MVSQGKKHSDEELHEVARVYMQAHESRLTVQQAVAKHLGISVSAAAKQIMHARSRGFLPEMPKLRVLRQYEKAQELLKELEKKL
jgi:hypothetical protein